MTRSTELLVLNFGAPAVTVCSRKNPFGVVHVEVTATPGGADDVDVRVRVQHVALGTSDGIPDAVATAWGPESPPVRVRYGASAPVRLTDADGQAWTITLYPDRLRGAGT